MVTLALLALLPIHDAAEITICKVISILYKPHRLPKMDFSEGIPDEFKTLVVYASLLSNKDAVERTLGHMENAHLNNKDKNLPIAALTHFKDSLRREVMKEETELLNFAISAIDLLNRKYGQGTFFLFYRDRKWNAVSQKWVGWERKRGGVEKLNKWLLGKIEGEEYKEYGPGKTFSHIAGAVDVLGKVSKIILLDSDNELPDGSARHLVEVAAHPLNQPVVGEAHKIVVHGYGVFQPFPIPSKESCARSVYARMEGWHRQPNGPHHYILQILQSFFREGTYIGKGIYDLETHEKVLGGRFLDNQLLSHDKVESGFLLAAFIPDVIIFEEALDNFLAGMNQIERWLKGDKQALRWVLPKIPDREWKCVKNPLPIFSRWNLLWPIEKQLSVLSLTLLCVVGWFVPVVSSKWISLIVAAMVSFPYIIVPLSLKSPVKSLIGIGRGLFSTVVYLAFFLHRALSILTVLVRIAFQFPKMSKARESIRGMKEARDLGLLHKFLKALRILAESVLRRPKIDWITASEVKKQRKVYSLSGIYSIMFPSLVICLVLCVGCFMFVNEFFFVLSVLGLWFAAPLMVYATSR
ncbi:MAG: hypothetical protein ACETWK_00730 [Candidatus Aminicenantaceae bacterium]